MNKSALILLCICTFQCGTDISCQEDFATSFIGAYDFFLSARDYREYHPFILTKAQNVLVQLENALVHAHLPMAERIIICGYQQDAFPSYFISDEKNSINDEFRSITDAGWQNPTGSLMGFLVGYLFKGVHKYIHPNNQLKIQHIGRDTVELFNISCCHLHKHALGNAFNLMTVLSRACTHAIQSGNMHNVLSNIYTLLKTAYTQELKDNAGRLFATQDILFPLYHLKHIMESPIPIDTFFVGPDITYPIEELPCQTQKATGNAQAFARIFLEHIQSPKTDKTAYLFCSFVDGVGKSTLFGNIINRCKHGDEIAKYEHVDNASSQACQFFQVNEQSYLIDLPACMSHIIGKPDGDVYIEPEALANLTPETIDSISSYISSHQNKLLDEYQTICADIVDYPKSNNHTRSFAELQILFDNRNCSWIPGSYLGLDFIFNHTDSSQIKILTPLNEVSSRGLKIAEPGHMLFNKPYLAPQKPLHFINDLITKIDAAGIERIVFVDFMSMYPRSSRETVRVNYLLQMMKQMIGTQFALNTSMYAGAAHEQELYLLLKKHRQQLEESLFNETLMRLALYRCVEQYQEDGVECIGQPKLRQDLNQCFNYIPEYEKKQIRTLVYQKIETESARIEKKYGHNKLLETYLAINMQELLEFSQLICFIFSKYIEHPDLQRLWQPLSAPVISLHNMTQTGEGKALLASGYTVDIIASWPLTCRDQLCLRRPLSLLRASWYATLTNLLNCSGPEEGPWHIQNMLPIMPYALVTDKTGQNCYLIRPHFTHLSIGPTLQLEPFCDNTIQLQWAVVNDMPLCLDMACGMVACTHYGYQPNYMTTGQIQPKRMHIDYAIEQLKNKRTSFEDFIATSELFSFCKKSVILQEAVSEALRNNKKSANSTQPKKAWQFCLLCLATLELILKDGDADIMIRSDKKEDFIAAVQLLEKIMLPRLFGIVCQEPLFDDYQHLEPVIKHTFSDLRS